MEASLGRTLLRLPATVASLGKIGGSSSQLAFEVGLVLEPGSLSMNTGCQQTIKENKSLVFKQFCS